MKTPVCIVATLIGLAPWSAFAASRVEDVRRELEATRQLATLLAEPPPSVAP